MSVPWYLMAKGKGGGGYKTASGPIVSVNDALAAPLRSLRVGIDPVQAGTGDPSPDNVRPISGWSAVNVWVKPTYDPTADPTATIQLGQTVYGATLDVTNGVLTVDRAYWTKNTSTMDNTDRYPGWKNSGIRDLIGAGVSAEFTNQIMNIGKYWSVNTLSTNDILYLGTARYNKTQTEWQALAIDVQILVPLATPIIIPLTPQEISTLQGQNNVWADTGDVTVEYLSAGGANPDLMKLAVAFMGR